MLYELSDLLKCLKSSKMVLVFLQSLYFYIIKTAVIIDNKHYR